jgi:hypothetical protein
MCVSDGLFGEAGVKYILKNWFCVQTRIQRLGYEYEKNAGLPAVIVSVAFHLLDLLWRVLHAI